MSNLQSTSVPWNSRGQIGKDTFINLICWGGIFYLPNTSVYLAWSTQTMWVKTNEIGYAEPLPNVRCLRVVVDEFGLVILDGSPDLGRSEHSLQQPPHGDFRWVELLLPFESS